MLKVAHNVAVSAVHKGWRAVVGRVAPSQLTQSSVPPVFALPTSTTSTAPLHRLKVSFYGVWTNISSSDIALKVAKPVGLNLSSKIISSPVSQSTMLRGRLYNVSGTQLRRYCKPAGEEPLMKPTSEEMKGVFQGNQEEFYPRQRSITGIFRGLYDLIIFTALGGSIFYLHEGLSVERKSSHLLSYLAFVPMLRLLPVFDLAQLSYMWLAIPLSTLGLSLLFPSRLNNRALLAIFGLAVAGVEVYKNYALLGHYEVYNLPNLVLASVSPTLNAVILSSLAVLGRDRHQLVPHEQAHFADWAEMFVAKLNESVDHPEIIPADNYPFRVWHWMWVNIPGLYLVPEKIAHAFVSTMEFIGQYTPPKAETSNQVEEVAETSTSTPQDPPTTSNNKQ